ncbi:hypothetical protein BaRGS_00013195 [Batillaria attramentaria]|uniref:Uncharacterized protein n=1 Tax=Batillaria attramentaria TaxID=370345 RepID=A0ABD0L7P8_9CAEN
MNVRIVIASRLRKIRQKARVNKCVTDWSQPSRSRKAKRGNSPTDPSIFSLSAFDKTNTTAQHHVVRIATSKTSEKEKLPTTVCDSAPDRQTNQRGLVFRCRAGPITATAGDVISSLREVLYRHHPPELFSVGDTERLLGPARCCEIWDDTRVIERRPESVSTRSSVLDVTPYLAQISGSLLGP